MKEKEEVFICGHRNPDMDSVCSAWAYAKLKNEIDPSRTYTAVRCGNLNAQTKLVVNSLGIEAPHIISDVYPRTKDIARRDYTPLSENDPVYCAIRELDDHNISIVPVFDAGKIFKGIVTTHEIARFFILDTVDERPEYLFHQDNFPTVLPGRFFKRGGPVEFEASIMVGAMPFDRSVDRLSSLMPKKPVLIAGLRRRLIEYAVAMNVPVIILTGLHPGEDPLFDFSGFDGAVFVSDIDTAETARLLRLSMPIKYLMDVSSHRLSTEDLYDEAKRALVGSDYRGLPVFRDGEFYGVVSRRCFIEKPKRKLILVDHNELSQAVPGAEEAEIIEILDHHRLGAAKTTNPIYLYAKPVGSTCTIVYEHYSANAMEIDAVTAKVLLAGILSDTVLLKSPTTTDMDRETAAVLSRIAGVDMMEYGMILFAKAGSLSSREPRDVITGDFKIYNELNVNVGIGQVETVTLEDIDEIRESLYRTLEGVKDEKRLDWVMLLVTNVIKEESMLLSSGYPKGEGRLIYKRTGDHLFLLPGVLSRKKQLLPEILRVLEEIA